MSFNLVFIGQKLALTRKKASVPQNQARVLCLFVKAQKLRFRTVLQTVACPMALIARCQLRWTGALAVWGLVVTAGFIPLENHAVDTCGTGSPPVQWPKQSRLPPPSKQFTLLIFLHPLCPCSPASVEELRYIRERCGLDVTICGAITGARGHYGDNDGRAAVVAHLRGTGNPPFAQPVFGCPLFAAGGELGEGLPR